jgi:hypothetical protein
MWINFWLYDGHLDLIKGVVTYMRRSYGIGQGFRLRFITMPLMVRVRLFFSGVVAMIGH